VWHGSRTAPADFASHVDVGGGRQLYLECRGTGSPTVILESGLRVRGDNWSREDILEPPATPVLSGVAAFTRVCTYDRGRRSAPATSAAATLFQCRFNIS
jgi:hypothetical protein